MEELKPKEKQVLDYIKKTMRENGYAPTVRDICEALEIRSTSSVHIYLERLEHKGYIKRESGKSRTMQIDSEQTEENKYRVPIIGQVAAGNPILAEESFEGYTMFSSPKNYDSNSLFALKIKGESMINVGILDSDYVIVEKRNYCENGEIVVALVEEEATVKRFYKENGHYRLQPENDNMKPIIVDEVQILGKIVALIRRY